MTMKTNAAIIITAMIIALLLPLTAFAAPIKIKILIQPEQNKEFTITVNEITKQTVNQEVIFEVEAGRVEITIGQKKIVKTITRSSKIHIHYEGNGT